MNKFKEKPKVKVFLMSLKAGALGLNLTAARRVVLTDPWWNPATEDQATDRVYRLGKKNFFRNICEYIVAIPQFFEINFSCETSVKVFGKREENVVYEV